MPFHCHLAYNNKDSQNNQPDSGYPVGIKFFFQIENAGHRHKKIFHTIHRQGPADIGPREDHQPQKEINGAHDDPQPDVSIDDCLAKKKGNAFGMISVERTDFFHPFAKKDVANAGKNHGETKGDKGFEHDQDISPKLIR